MDRSAVAVTERFMELFAGMTRAYGIYTITGTREDGKQVGDTKSISTLRQDVTKKVWEAHLSGKQGIGIIPIRDGNDCVFGAIDIDDYRVDHKAIIAKLRHASIPMMVGRTKSGGAHVWCFALKPVAASMMKRKLSEVASYLGYGNAEIFPKQTQILSAEGDVGQWINMPYFNGTRGMRYAVDIDGNALSPEDFLTIADMVRSQTTPEFFNKLLVLNADFEDGPPCLQVLAAQGFPPGTRNDGLYNIGVYLRQANPDDWQNQLETFNHRFLRPPLELTEVQGLIRSLGKKDYRYGCTRQPIVQFCNSSLCRSRKFGVNVGSQGNFPILGGLTMYNVSPPIFFWMVDDKRLQLDAETLQNPRKFQLRCIEALGKFPPIPSAQVWQAAVQNALDNMTIIEAPADASPEGQFWEWVEKFCTSKSQARELADIILGKPYTDVDAQTTSFRMMDLVSYLNRNKFVSFSTTKISSLLRDAGAEHFTKSINKRTVNFWTIRAFAHSSDPLKIPDEASDTGEVF